MLLITCFLLLATPAGAQQFHLNNQFLVNEFSISPAFAGSEPGFSTFAMYRQDWIGFDGAPEVKMFSASGRINEKMGIGATITSDNMGIFRNFSANLAYAYHLQVATNHWFSFALTAGIYDSGIELANGTPMDQLDPVAMNNSQVVSSTLIDVGFGGLYRYKNWKAAFYGPRLMEPEIKDETGGNRVLYTMTRHAFGIISYKHEIKDFEFEPIMVVRKTLKSPVSGDMVLKTTYKKMIFLGLGYRKGSILTFSLGGEYNSFVMHYAYEFSGEGMLANSNGTHEITLGYRFKSVKKKDVPSPTQKKPYYKWVE